VVVRLAVKARAPRAAAAAVPVKGAK